MRSVGILAVLLALSVAGARGFHHQRSLNTTSVTPADLGATASPSTTKTFPPEEPDTSPPGTGPTTTDTFVKCSGTVTIADGLTPETVTVTLTETFLVGPTEPLPEPIFYTPPPPCETTVPNDPLLTSSRVTRTTLPPATTVATSRRAPTTTVFVTKKTPVRDVPPQTLIPPTFNDSLSPGPSEPGVTQGEPSAAPIVTAPAQSRPAGTTPPPPPPQHVPVDDIVSDILDQIQPSSANSNPSSPSPRQFPPSTISSPPDAASTILLANVPVTVVQQTILIIGPHSLTVTRNPTPNTSPPFDDLLGPTTTLTVDGTPITVAPPVIIAGGTTLILNPHLLTSTFPPSPTSGGTGTASGSAGPSSTNIDGVDPPTSSNAAGASSHKHIFFLSGDLTTLTVTVICMIISVSWVFLLVG